MSFYFTLLDCVHFCNQIEKCQLQKPLTYFSILRPVKSSIRSEYVPWKNVWFCFTPMVLVHVSHKNEKFWFWKLMKYLICFDKKMVSDLNMSHGKMFDFVSFPLFGFTLVIKLRNSEFESHWNILIYFDKKRCAVRFKYVPWKNVHCLSSL